MGIVKNTDSLLAFSLITVLKKDQTLRLCVVYRKLNKITGSGRINAKSGRYVCQTVNSKIFHEDWFVEWILENCDGEDSKKYTAFSYPLGNIVWTLSFGLTGVPMAFTKLMRKLTWGRQDIVYISTACFIPLLMNTSVAFNLCCKPSLNLDWKLYFQRHLFHSKRSLVFGYLIRQGNIMPEPIFVKTILTISLPYTKCQVHSLLGLNQFL